MGSIYYILEDFKQALPYFEKSFQLNDSDAETLRLKTNVHLALEQKDDAIDCCYRILKIDPKNSEAQDLIKELERI
jgi:tetratricopeptide (TPR) repeat protein